LAKGGSPHMQERTAREFYRALESFYFRGGPGWGRDKLTATLRRALKARTMKRLLRMNEPSKEKKKALLILNRNFALLAREICKEFPLLAPEMVRSLWGFIFHGQQSIFTLRDAFRDFSKKTLPRRPGGGRPPAFQTAQEEKELFENFTEFIVKGLEKGDAVERLKDKTGWSGRTIRRKLAKYRETAQKEFSSPPGGAEAIRR
jgi:hypothetical protein